MVTSGPPQASASPEEDWLQNALGKQIGLVFTDGTTLSGELYRFDATTLQVLVEPLLSPTLIYKHAVRLIQLGGTVS
jgi:hypothetical protein